MASRQTSTGRRNPVEVEVAEGHGSESVHCSYVVGVGASAGGLRPLEQLFSHMPVSSGVAFVVVQHLSPDFKSLMHELLSRQTKMPVHRVEDQTILEPDSVYLIPPRKIMTIREGELRLEDQDTSPGHPLQFPIDLFFESLAMQYRERSIAVVLSGTGSDGTRGIKSIAEAGGLVLVQDPETSEFDGMPRSAIATGLAHFIESPDQIARTVFGYVKQAREVNYTEPPTPQELLDVGRISEVTALLMTDDGVDFTHYKPATLARRISRRMLVARCGSVSEYLRILASSVDERNALRNDLLIGVTSFFRDPLVWRFLEQTVIDKLVQDATGPLRVWVTACSTGEEVYSLAMLMHEAMERFDKRVDLKIFATDIDRGALDRASAGRFDESIETDVGESRVSKFFLRRGTQLVVRRELRESIIFSAHNLLRDAPFTKLDLVTCRNVLIYMQPELQERVMATLHFGLRHRGVMVLGAAEAPGSLEDEFEELNKKLRVYAKARDVTLPLERRRPLAAQIHQRPSPIKPERISGGGSDTVLNAGFRAILDRFGGLCLVLDPDLQVQHVFGDSRRYLSVPEGAGTTGASELLPEALALPLRTASHRARIDGVPALYKNLRIEVGGEVERVDLDVRFTPARRAATEFFLVLMTPVESLAPRDVPGEEFDIDVASADRISELERELQHTRENLQATIEELETTNEEQQASNEELLASNEELQSTNEELHSVNEELYTVNAEYQQKITELTELNNDMDNLLASTEIATIFLDPRLRIRKFTPSATELIHFVDHDIGRPINDFSTAIVGADIAREASDVLDRKTPRELEVTTKSGRPLLMRLQLYMTSDNNSGGVVITFVDIAVIKETQRDLAEQKELFSELLEHITEVFWITSADGTDVLYLSPAFETIWGRSPDEACRECGTWLTEIHKKDEERVGLAWQAFLGGGAFDIEFRLTPDSGGATKWIHARGWLARDESGEVVRRVGIAEDVTAVREFQMELERRVEARTTELEQAHSRLESAQEQLRDAYDYAPDMMVSVSAETGIVQDCNETLCDRLGYPRDEVIGMPVWELYHSDSVGRSRELFDQFKLTGDVRDARLKLAAKSGQAIDVSLNTTAFRDETGRIVRSRSTWRDISELCRAEDELRRHKDSLELLVEDRTAQLAQKNKEMEELVYTVSHDLKSPLVTVSGMVGYLKRMIQEGNIDRVDELMLTVEETALRMREKIDNLLELSRLGRRSEREPVNLGEIAIEVIHEHAHSLKAGKACHTIADKLPTVMADRHQMQRIFDNLVSNALTYGRIEGKQLQIDIGAEASTDCYRVFFRDNGPGIEEIYHERVFGLFSRIAATGDGAGVGLALVRRIMDLHGGRVWIESARDEGATFWLEFPMDGS